MAAGRSNVIPLRHKLQPFEVCKASETKRPYMARRYGRDRFKIRNGKACYLPPKVWAMLAAMIEGMERHERRMKNGRPYIYAFEVIYEMMREVGQ